MSDDDKEKENLDAAVSSSEIESPNYASNTEDVTRCSRNHFYLKSTYPPIFLFRSLSDTIRRHFLQKKKKFHVALFFLSRKNEF